MEKKYLLFSIWNIHNANRYISELMKVSCPVQYRLSIDFDSYLKENLQGFYLSSYKNEGGEKRYLATTNFLPTAARSAFPCFDEPAMKATFQLKIVHDVHYSAYFNSEILLIAPYAEGLSISSFHKTVKMSTYLVAFLVCDFTELEIADINGINIRMLAPAEHSGKTEFALEIAAEVLQFYKKFFNISYPLSKLDMAAIPDLTDIGGENWGLVSFRLTDILYSSSETSTFNQEIVASIVSHKLVNQWFGNLVTMQWWNDFWLNNIFATFMEYIALDNVKSEWKMRDDLSVIFTQHALMLDSLLSTHPVVTEAVDYSEIPTSLDIISYRKGPAVINMLSNFLGMETFQKGLSSYLNKYSLQNVRSENLWNEFTEVDVSHINVSQVMDAWIRQKGYPLITVTHEHSTVKIKQERYLLKVPESDDASSSDISPDGYKWFVPVTYVTNLSNRQNTYWLNTSNGEFTLPAEVEWLKVNVNQTGFYRVMYDIALWEKLIDVLHSNHKVFSPADRANLVDDAVSFTRSGILDTELAFNLTRYLGKEIEYAPWRSALFRFEHINLIMRDCPLFLPFFQKYVRYLLKPVISTLGWEDTGSHMQKKLRSVILVAGVLYGEEHTVYRAKEIFQDWMKNGVKVPLNIRSAVYNAGVKYGGKEEWEFCLRKYQETQDSSEKYLLLVALASTQETSRLSLYLNYCLDEEIIRPEDALIAIVYAARNLIGPSVTWPFVRSNWNTLLQMYGTENMGYIIDETITYFTTQEDYNEIKAFFEEVNAGAVIDSLNQSLETMKINIQWRQNLEAFVFEWSQENFI
ncbi:glutamyl aminopeptidase-like [Stegodyphus dumicola]|uniref:glutamyl aminopeptidase-like n=1 Tax=Stegodyphus dumicola TaxID=202533 RepID=UPI0015AC0C52|nr:glutamyl aminopeptidase-like [Stegodyphus dumicola]